MTTTPCRGCGNEIGFITMTSNVKMPVDPELVTEWVVFGFGGPSDQPRVSLVSEKGELRQGRRSTLTDPAAERLEGYISHFATCTAAERFRQRG